MEGYLVVDLVATEFLFAKLSREGDRDIAGVTSFHSDKTASESGDRAILLELEPEILAAGVGGLEVGIGLGKSLAFDGSLVVEDGKIPHGYGLTLGGSEIGEIAAKSLEKLLHIGIGDFLLLDGNLKSLVLGKVEGGTGHNRRGESEGTVPLKLDVADIGALDRY